MFHPFGNEETQTKARQFGELHVTLGENIGADTAGHGHGPIDLHRHKPLNSNGSDGQIAVDANLAVRCHKVGAVGTGNRLIVMGGKPFGLELAVVVRGSTPDVQIHGAIQNFLPLIGHPGKHTGELIVAVREVCGGKGQIPAVLGNGDAILQHRLSLPIAQCNLVTVVLILQRNLVKAQFKSLRNQFRGILSIIVDLQEAASLGRNLNI